MRGTGNKAGIAYKRDVVGGITETGPYIPTFTGGIGPPSGGNDGDLWGDQNGANIHLKESGSWDAGNLSDASVNSPYAFAASVPADGTGPHSVAVPNGRSYDLFFWDGDSWEADTLTANVPVALGTPMWPDGATS